jgi:hypothetical protein
MRLTPRAGFGPVPELPLGGGAFLLRPPYTGAAHVLSRKIFALLLEPVTYNADMARKLPPEFRRYLSKLGRKGGLKGGPARAAKLTPEQRSASARKAVMARWQKAKAGK